MLNLWNNTSIAIPFCAKHCGVGQLMAELNIFDLSKRLMSHVFICTSNLSITVNARMQSLYTITHYLYVFYDIVLKLA